VRLRRAHGSSERTATNEPKYTRCVAAAKHLLLQHGAVRLTAGDIVRETDIGTAAFYRCFATVDALLDAVDVERVSDLEREHVLALLVERYAIGELDMDEFEARAAHVARADRWGDVRIVLADLPARSPFC
jgi:AcrR family transcriptional regulator